ncbi:MAG: putative toxin-antitoxin system toxin component, PIN family [Verrucomicrobiota bacterium]
MSKPRAVMDTNVLVAAFRSRTGASFEILQRLRRDEWTAVLSNHLIYEYEEVLKRDAATLSLALDDVDQILNALCARGEEWPLTHNWEPVLPDPDDEPLVQLAQESAALVIVTHNTGHLHPAAKLGIQVLKPRQFLARLRQSK